MKQRMKNNRVLMSVILFSVMLLSILNISPTPSYACSCMPPGPVTEELERSSAVFSGKVIEIVDKNKNKFIQSSADPMAVKLKVAEIWKGQSQTEIIVYTERDSASCGFNFELNKDYLVYANEMDGELRVSLCSRTAPLANATIDIQELGEGEIPTDSNVNNSGDKMNNESTVNSYTKYFFAAVVGLLVVVIAFLIRRIKK